MAESGYGCEFGDCPAAVNHLITTLNPAATVGLCDEHYGPGMIPLLGAELGVDPMGFYAAVEKFLKAEAKKADRELAEAEAAAAAEAAEALEQRPGINLDGTGPTATEAAEANALEVLADEAAP